MVNPIEEAMSKHKPLHTEEQTYEYLARAIASIEGFSWSLPDTQRGWLIRKCNNLRTLLNTLRHGLKQKKEQE